MISGLQDRVNNLTEILVEQAGKDPTNDRWIAGYIAGINDFLKTEYQELV